MFSVVISEKGGPQQTHDFDKTEVTIGRVKGNDIVLPKGNVSKRHSRIVVKDGKFIIVDLKSTNGTYVNGRKISAPQVIKESDKIYIGDFIMTVQERGGAGASPGGPPSGPPPGMRPPGGPPSGPGGPPPGLGPGGPPGLGPGPGGPPPGLGPKPGGPPPGMGPGPGGPGGPPGLGPKPGGPPPGLGPGGPPGLGPGPGGPPPGLGPKPGGPPPGMGPGPGGPGGPPPGMGPGPGGPPSGLSGPGGPGGPPGLGPKPGGPPPGMGPGPGGPPPGMGPGPGGPPPGLGPKPGGPPPGMGPGPGGPPSGMSGPGSGVSGPPGLGPKPGGPPPGMGPGPGGPGGPPSGMSSGPSGPGRSPSGLSGPPGPSGPSGGPSGPAPSKPSSPSPSASSSRFEASAGAPASSAAPAAAVPVYTRPPIGRATMPSRPQLHETGDGQAAQRLEAKRMVMEHYLSTIDVRELPEMYPPDEQSKMNIQEGLRQQLSSVSIPGGVSQDELLGCLLNEAVGLGPLEYFLDDDSVTEILVNGPTSVIIERNGQRIAGERGFVNADTLYTVALRLLSMQGYTSNQVLPSVSEVRFGNGTLVQIMLPPVSVGGATLVVRKANRAPRSLSQLVEQGFCSNAMAEFLHQCVEARRSVLIAGPHGSGRTTLASALLGLVPDGARIVCVERTSMLSLPHRSAIRLETQAANAYAPAVDMPELVEHAVRLCPERLVIDEIRGSEAHGFLLGCAGGAAGSFGIVAGWNAADATRRLASAALSGAHVSEAQGIIEQIARSVDVVVVLNQFPDGSRRIAEIAEVAGPAYGHVDLEPVFSFELEGMGQAGGGSGRFRASGYVPRFYRELENGGVQLDQGIFRD